MARRLGVNRSCVTVECRPGGRLHAALHVDGKRINVRHEAAQSWLARVTSPDHWQPAAPAAKPNAAKPRAAEVEADSTPDAPDSTAADTTTAAETEAELGPWRAQIDLASLVEPLTTLTEKYGEHREFQKWIDQRRHLAQARKEEMLQARVQGRLIARTTVERMIGHLDVTFRLLLTDAPRTIATRIAPDDMAQTAAIIRDAMAQLLEASKTQLIESLSNDDPLTALEEAAA